MKGNVPVKEILWIMAIILYGLLIAPFMIWWIKFSCEWLGI